jgi:ATP-binding protein involved in chromosome partitioning
MSTGLIVSEAEVINPSAEVAGQVVVQTLRDVQWGELDILVIDLPPSAGQPQQDLVARVQIDGVVIVTTPQDLSLLDSSRALQMYAQAGVPVVGLVENMSYFVCPHCGERHEIFQHTESWRPAALTDAPVLGRIPLTAEISRSITREHPLMAGAVQTAAEKAQAAVFVEIARAVQNWQRVHGTSTVKRDL